MKINCLELNNFRNAKNEVIEFSDGVNLLCGKNAQGKTNAVEAIYYLASLKSFRCPKYREMIAHDSNEAKISAQIELSDRKVTLSATLPKNAKRSVTKNGVRPQKLSEYMGVFRAVLFCPEHLRLVKDGPGERRAFIDQAICQLKPIYASYLNEFNRISSHRMALFRAAASEPAALESIEVWDRAYAKYSLKISRERREYVEKLEKKAIPVYKNISSEAESLSLSYQSDAELDLSDAEDLFVEQLFNHRKTELKNLVAPKGAHRDDLIIKLDSKSARFYASQGQQRSVVLALKLAEGALSEETTGETPVFLLDDVLSELDELRRSFILSNIKAGQVVITSCDTDLFTALPDITKIQVERGKYRRV